MSKQKPAPDDVVRLTAQVSEDQAETLTQGVFLRGSSDTADRAGRLIVGEVDLGTFRQLQRQDAGFILSFDPKPASGDAHLVSGHPSEPVLAATIEDVTIPETATDVEVFILVS